MASYTIEMQFLLRGFTDFNNKPGLYASPHSIIENSRERFFKTIGNYSFSIWSDERDEPFRIEFEKAFLEYFFMKEIGYQTPDAFYLELGSFLRRKMPIYCRSWRAVLDEMYVTNVSSATGTSGAKNSSATDSWGKSNNESTFKNDTDSVSRNARSDTPQSMLDIDLDDIAYASEVTKDENSINNTGNSESDTNNEDHSVTVGNNIGNTTSASQGRSKDVFDIYNQWITSGYDLFTPLFEDMMRAQLFVIFN